MHNNTVVNTATAYCDALYMLCWPMHKFTVRWHTLLPVVWHVRAVVGGNDAQISAHSTHTMSVQLQHRITRNNVPYRTDCIEMVCRRYVSSYDALDYHSPRTSYHIDRTV